MVIAGPTAVGKTDVAITLARNFDTEILSADSRQFYKEMSIGTAKPDAKQLSAVKHHFVGQRSIHDYYNVSRFENDARALLCTRFETDTIVFVAVGSGL